MSGYCGGSDKAEENVEPVVDSVKVEDISIPCAKDKIMYIYPQGDGFLAVIQESSKERESLPQFLKVKVDGKKSCRAERYYFQILEGPYANKAIHWDTVYSSSKNKWNVVKKYKGYSTLIEENPHITGFDLTCVYTRPSLRKDDKDGTKDGIRIANSISHGKIAVASIQGTMIYNGKTTTVRMELDVIKPNKKYNVSIPDFPHKGGNRYIESVPKARLWMRLDAATSPVKWKEDSVGSDRYLHYGTGSAGCFTNIKSADDWNSIIDDLSRSRVNKNDLYAGTIMLKMDEKVYNDLGDKLAKYAKENNVSYVWDNAVHTP